MKVNLLFIVFIPLLLLSCNSDDGVSEPQITYEDGEFPEKIMVGSWFLRSQNEIDDFGAQNFTVITGTLKIYPAQNSSDFAVDLTPLRSLERIEKHLLIWKNPELTSLEGLHNIKSLGELAISGNESLKNLDGLRNLTDIYWENPGQPNDIESLLSIVSNPLLENIDGLKNIASAMYITIGNNMSLQNLNGFENLIENHYFRTDSDCDGDPSTPTYCGNQNLNDFCGLQNLFSNGNSSYVRIVGNAYNPTIQDIIGGNCSQ